MLDRKYVVSRNIWNSWSQFLVGPGKWPEGRGPDGRTINYSLNKHSVLIIGRAGPGLWPEGRAMAGDGRTRNTKNPDQKY